MKSGFAWMAFGLVAMLALPACSHLSGKPAPGPEVPRPDSILDPVVLFNQNCAGCHGASAVAGPLPDLRYASTAILEGIDGIVLGGSRASAGMPSFQKILKPGQVDLIRSYIVSRARASAKPADQGSQ